MPVSPLPSLPPRIESMVRESLAIEQEDARSAGMLGFMSRSLIQATLPHSDPKTHCYVRTTGLVTLSIIGRPNVGIPYGSLPRTLLAWICTEAVRTKSRVLDLGRSQREFLTRLGLGTGGSYTRPLHNQAHRLFSSLITVEGKAGDDVVLDNTVIAKSARLFWNPRKPDQKSLWQSELELTRDFYEDVVSGPVPIDLRVLNQLRKAPLSMDIYTWVTYRQFLMHAKGQSMVKIPWQALQAQFGANYGSKALTADLTEEEREAKAIQATRHFKSNFLRRLNEVAIFYPALSSAVTETSTHFCMSATTLHLSHKKVVG